jgi:sigma-B regulation protein RsbU (phosphoserine phosphatase)
MMQNPPSASIIEDLEDLYENAPCGYLSLDPRGRIFKVNKTLCSWIGYAPEQMLGKRLGDLLNIAGRMFYETHIAPLLRMQGFFNEVALDLLSRSGERLPVIANAAERRAADGSVISTRLTLLMAADRRRYEQGLLAARDQSRSSEAAARAILRDERETSELREQFIAVLGHDLRNPLASINAGARILLRRPRDETETRVLHMMEATVTRMSGLIDNVLDFARGRLGGGITLSRDAKQPLEPVLRQVVDELSAAMPERVIEHDFRCRPGRLRPLPCRPIGFQSARQRADPRGARPARQGVCRDRKRDIRTLDRQRRRTDPGSRDGQSVPAVFQGTGPRQPSRTGPRFAHRFRDRQGP